MIESRAPVLPPGLDGETQFILTLTIDEILWELDSQSVQVRVEWWGQKREQAQVFTPVDVENFTRSKIGDVLYVKYEVHTSATKFTEYLQDASPLKIEVIDQHDQVVGSSLVQNLERITDSSCGLEGYFPVLNSETNEIVANVRIHFLLESLEELKNKSSQPNSVPTTKKTIKSRGTTSASKSLTKSSSLKARGKVKFFEEKTEDGQENQKTTEGSARLRHGREKSPKAPLADSIVSELLNQSQELRKSMQQKLASNFLYDSDKSSESKNRLGEPRSVPREVVPSWNLPVERMRVLACVSRLEISVTSVQISPVILDKLLQKDSRSKLRESGSVSFFVKYKLPSDSEDTSFCTRKLKGNFAEFNERRTLPITFTSDTLEEWWNYKTDFKIFTRHLGQRVPLLLGEASLGMKYLLLHDRYTGGAPLSLPVYVSNSLFRDLKLPTNTSEIVGNIHLSIQLSYRGSVKARNGEQNSCSSTKIINEDSRQKDQTNSKRSTDSVESDNTQNDQNLRKLKECVPEAGIRQSQRSKITINSRPHKDTLPVFQDIVYLEMRVSVTDSADDFVVKHRNLDLCEGRVAKGEDLVVTSVLFMPGEQGSIHNRLMLSRLSQNYLILQVWRNGQLVGISKVETEPIHAAYQDGEIRDDKCLVFYDGNIDVVDIFDGQAVAELRIKVRVGSESFISPPDNIKTSMLCQKDITLNDNGHENATSGHKKTRQHCSDIDNSKSVQTSFLGCENEENKKPDQNDNLLERPSLEENGKDSFLVEILIEEARNLPRLKTKDGKIVPKAYVTLFENSSNMSTQVKESTCPVWNHQVQTKLDSQYVHNPRKFLILKVWHHRGSSGEEPMDNERDQVLGYVAVDLTPLSLVGFPQVSGWYNITDWLGKCRGQIKLTVTPLQALDDKRETLQTDDELNETGGCESGNLDFYATGQYSRFPSHLLPHSELMIRSKARSSPDLSVVSEVSRSSSRPCHLWQEPITKSATEDGVSISMLERKLHTHLEDLNNLTRSWTTNVLLPEESSHDSSNRTFTIDEANRNDSVILVDTRDNDLVNTEKVLKKNLENLKSFVRQSAGLLDGSGRSSRTSLLSDDLPRDDQPDLMDLGLVLEDLEQILDLDTDRSKNGNGSSVNEGEKGH